MVIVDIINYVVDYFYELLTCTKSSIVPQMKNASASTLQFFHTPSNPHSLVSLHSCANNQGFLSFRNDFTDAIQVFRGLQSI